MPNPNRTRGYEARARGGEVAQRAARRRRRTRANGAHRATSMSAKPRHSNDANRSTAAMSAGEKAGRRCSLATDSQPCQHVPLQGLKWVHGKLTGKGLVSDAVSKNKPARVQPDRRWFGNTRVVGSRREQLSRRICRSSRPVHCAAEAQAAADGPSHGAQPAAACIVAPR